VGANTRGGNVPYDLESTRARGCGVCSITERVGSLSASNYVRTHAQDKSHCRQINSKWVLHCVSTYLLYLGEAKCACEEGVTQLAILLRW
jgi:hypothetical protein